MLAFFKMYVSATSSSSRVFHGGVQTFGMGSSVSMVVKNSIGAASSRSYAEALVGLRLVLSSVTRHRCNYGISDGSGLRGSDVRGKSALRGFSGNPLNHVGTVCTKVLEGDMGVNLDFHALRRLMVLLKKELERCIVKLGEGCRPHEGDSDIVKSKPIGSDPISTGLGVLSIDVVGMTMSNQ